MSPRAIWTDATWVDGLRSLPEGPRGAWAFLTRGHHEEGLSEVARTSLEAELEAICRAIEWASSRSDLEAVTIYSDCAPALHVAKRGGGTERSGALTSRIAAAVRRSGLQVVYLHAHRNTPQITDCDAASRRALRASRRGTEG